MREKIPKTTKKKTIIDELCNCGHRKSEHAADGRGACLMCEDNNGERGEPDKCSRFTWDSFIFKK